jgi:hypothetical protein
LKIIAEKTVCRTPRFMIPIVSVIVFEYFMMDVGAVTYLEYLPSITWSPWPSTSVYPNFGWFLNETLQLIYLIPNAAPQLTWNYCTGKHLAPKHCEKMTLTISQACSGPSQCSSKTAGLSC